MDTRKFKTGTLTDLGYKTTSSAASRHAALDKAVRKYGKGTVVKKLNAVSILNKHRPVGEIFARDKRYVQGL